MGLYPIGCWAFFLFPSFLFLSVVFHQNKPERGRKTICKLHVAFADGGNGTLVACAASQSAIHYSNASWLHSTILVLAFLLFHTSSLVPAWSGGLFHLRRPPSSPFYQFFAAYAIHYSKHHYLAMFEGFLRQADLTLLFRSCTRHA